MPAIGSFPWREDGAYAATAGQRDGGLEDYSPLFYPDWADELRGISWRLKLHPSPLRDSL